MSDKEKLVTIVMPVGKEAGKKVKVTEKQAESIRKQFGEYTQPRAPRAPAASGDAELVASLQAKIAEQGAYLSAIEEVLTAEAGEAEKLTLIGEILHPAA